MQLEMYYDCEGFTIDFEDRDGARFSGYGDTLPEALRQLADNIEEDE